MIDNKVVVGISQGDINGIGYEIIIKALSDPRINDMCIPVLYGSPKVAAYHRKALNMESFSFNQAKDIKDINTKRPNIINCMDENVRVELGKSTEYGGQGAFNSLEAAVTDLKAGQLDVLVTAPINKHNIQPHGFNFSGHTEYLAHKFNAQETLMLMVGSSMRVGVVTGHVPLGKVAGLITTELVIKKIKTLNEVLKKDFAIRRPRIAVLGLNPHAGDSGLLGAEEQAVIIPAITKVNEEGIAALGPYPADGFFGADSFTKFDGVLAMYHDQGLAPFKAISFDSGVNFTAGLPIVRTSPAHGTAYEIAGQGIASPEPFLQSMYLAIDLFKNRAQHAELTKNPLKTVDPDRY